MDMQEARDIAVRFLGGLPVSDDEVFEAGNLIRESFSQDDLVDDDLGIQVDAAAVVARDDDLDEVRTLRVLAS
jgi:hypothetical protein